MSDINIFGKNDIFLLGLTLFALLALFLLSGSF